MNIIARKNTTRKASNTPSPQPLLSKCNIVSPLTSLLYDISKKKERIIQLNSQKE